MIKGAWYRNYQSLRALDLEFERLTVFVGRNGSGKTGILHGLERLCHLVNTPEPARSTLAEGMLPSLSGGCGGEMELGCATGHGAVRVRIHRERAGATLALEESSEDLADWRQFCAEKANGRASVPSAVLLRLDAELLAQPHYSNLPVPLLSPRGEGLASMLASMALNQPNAFHELQQRLREVLPTVTGLRFVRVPLRHREEISPDGAANGRRRKAPVDVMGVALVFDTVGATSVPAAQVSEGALLVTGLLAALHGPKRPGLLLIDGIERGLHPTAQQTLVPLLRRLLDGWSNLQIVATTHSPYVLDHLKPEEVRLACLREDGATTCARLTQHPRYDRWKQELTPGEFWTMIGEEWIDRPVPALGAED